MNSFATLSLRLGLRYNQDIGGDQFILFAMCILKLVIFMSAKVLIINLKIRDDVVFGKI